MRCIGFTFQRVELTNFLLTPFITNDYPTTNTNTTA